MTERSDGTALQETRPPQIGPSLLLFGVVLVAWIFALCAQIAFMIHDLDHVPNHTTSRLADLFYLAPPFWFVLHMTAIGVLTARSRVSVTGDFSSAAAHSLSIMLLSMLALLVFFEITEFRYLGKDFHSFPQPYTDVRWATPAALLFSLTFNHLYSVTRFRIILALFVIFPMLVLAVLIRFWPAELLMTRYQMTLPPIIPTPALYGGMIATLVTAGCIFGLGAKIYGVPQDQRSAWWLAGICGLAISHVGFMGVLSPFGHLCERIGGRFDWEWIGGLNLAFIMIEIALFRRIRGRVEGCVR